MPPGDLAKLLEDLAGVLAARPGLRVAVVGRAVATVHIVGFLATHGRLGQLVGLYAVGGDPSVKTSSEAYAPIDRLAGDRPDVVVVSEDAEKESLLVAMASHIPPGVRVILGGYGHLAFRDEMFGRVVRDCLVPSLANGYPNCLVHLYQCLRSAARLKLEGIVAEFGMFRGGTTMLLSRFIEELGASWKVIGFDTFAGFPPPRSVLDLYAHPDCVFFDELSVRRYLTGRKVEIVAGDVVSTAARLCTEDVVLAFVDTDNHTSASAILNVITDRIVVGGAIVFDHWAGRERHVYTVGERIAASRLVDDPRFFNLHDTGVFVRLV